MQKKIIALAIAGLSTAAFAQSNVTISGNFDTGINTVKTTSAAGVTSKITKYGSSSGSSTTNLTFTATENLGNGMTAGVVMETDPTAGSSSTAGLNNSQNYLFVNGGFGQIKLGLFNNAGLTPNTTSQPFGTGMAGGYGGNFSRLHVSPANVGAGVLNGTLGGRSIRTDNQFQYMTPSFGGFTASLGLHKGNADAASGSANLVGDEQTQLGLNYNNGPLNVAFTNEVVKGKGTLAAVAAVASTATSTSSACAATPCTPLVTTTLTPAVTAAAAGSLLGNGVKVTHNMFGANYTMGPVTGYVGMTTTKDNTAAVLNAASKNVAVKYTMGNLSFMGNLLWDNDKTAGDDDRKLTGLGMDYSMSKRTTAYVRYEKWDNDTHAANNDGTAYQFGIRHSF